MKLLESLKFLLQASAVTLLPAALVWWWNNTTAKARSNVTAYFWTFIIAVGLFGIVYELITTGTISAPSIEPGY